MKKKETIPQKTRLNGRLTLRIEQSLEDKLRRKALAHSVDISVIARHALESYFTEE